MDCDQRRRRWRHYLKGRTFPSLSLNSLSLSSDFWGHAASGTKHARGPIWSRMRGPRPHLYGLRLQSRPTGSSGGRRGPHSYANAQMNLAVERPDGALFSPFIYLLLKSEPAWMMFRTLVAERAGAIAWRMPSFGIAAIDCLHLAYQANRL